MPSNLEIKGRVGDLQKTLQLAREISSSPGEILEQEDTFFSIPHGRLKLRIINSSQAELIYYERADIKGPRTSQYCICPSTNPGQLKDLLAAALGIRGSVKKRRHLFLTGQTRIHLDEVEGLGVFLELEYVLKPGESLERAMDTVQTLRRQLKVPEENLVPVAYLDLLVAQEKD